MAFRNLNVQAAKERSPRLDENQRFDGVRGRGRRWATEGSREARPPKRDQSNRPEHLTLGSDQSKGRGNIHGRSLLDWVSSEASGRRGRARMDPNLQIIRRTIILNYWRQTEEDVISCSKVHFCMSTYVLPR